MYTVSVVIVAYRSESEICDCIDSIFASMSIGDSVEVIVVDNSSDESCERTQLAIYRRYGERVRCFAMKSNVGYGRGNNFGIEICSADLVCVMNPDVRMQVPLFTTAREIFLKNENLAMLAFRQVGGKNLSFYFYPELFFPLIGSFILKLCNRLNTFHKKVFFPSGALVFLDRGKFLEIGGYDEKIFLYCEDCDLAKNFVNAGYGLRYDHSLHYEHLIELSKRVKRTDDSLRIEYESMKYYFSKHGFSRRSYYIKRLLDYKFRSLIYLFSNHPSKNVLARQFDLFARIFYGK